MMSNQFVREAQAALDGTCDHNPLFLNILVQQWPFGAIGSALLSGGKGSGFESQDGRRDTIIS